MTIYSEIKRFKPEEGSPLSDENDANSFLLRILRLVVSVPAPIRYRMLLSPLHSKRKCFGEKVMLDAGCYLCESLQMA